MAGRYCINCEWARKGEVSPGETKTFCLCPKNIKQDSAADALLLVEGPVENTEILRYEHDLYIPLCIDQRGAHVIQIACGPNGTWYQEKEETTYTLTRIQRALNNSSSSDMICFLWVSHIIGSVILIVLCYYISFSWVLNIFLTFSCFFSLSLLGVFTYHNNFLANKLYSWAVRSDRIFAASSPPQLETFRLDNEEAEYLSDNDDDDDDDDDDNRFLDLS